MNFREQDHSSLWGGDLQAFILQASARNLQKRSQIALSAGDHVMPQLGQKMPDGIILGARGVNGLASKALGGELTDTLWNAYEKEHGVIPVQAPYRMWQALLGLKTAVEKAMAANGGTKPDAAQLAAAMKGLSWEAPSGKITMALADGHQAIQPNAIGTTKWDESKKQMTLVDLEYYDAECVNPPEGQKAEEWIAALPIDNEFSDVFVVRTNGEKSIQRISQTHFDHHFGGRNTFTNRSQPRPKARPAPNRRSTVRAHSGSSTLSLIAELWQQRSRL